MRFFLVDVKSITPSKPVEQFDKMEVEKLADSILECNGLSKPLILKPTGPESYVVIQGDMEFHAAVRAREKDPRKGEMVNAFVISPKAEETVLKQIQRLQGAATPSPEHIVNHGDSSVQKDRESVSRKEDISFSQLLQEVKNINRKVEDLNSLPSQFIKMMERNFSESFNLLSQKIANLENTFNQKFEQLSGSIKPVKPVLILIPPEKEQAFLDFLNDKETLGLPKISGIGPVGTKAIISNRPYNSIDDVKNKLNIKILNILISYSQKNL